MRALSQIAIFLISFTLFVGRAMADAPGDNRFVIVVGANDGLSTDDLLRYAESDAEDFRNLMVELGSASSERTYLLQGEKPEKLFLKLSEVRGAVAELQRLGRPSTVIFYFSGHGDGEAIHMNGAVVPLADLRRELGSIPARLKVSILDACRTGGRVKGVRRGSAVQLALGSEGPHGTVEIRASSEGEAAQESEELRGAIFTHFLVTGLRGAADADGDGTVNLGELYSYTYRRTLQRSSTAQVLQHPELSAELAGAGDIVLTWPNLGTAFLNVPANPGQYLIFSIPSSRLVGELAGDRAARLAVPTGQLLVVRRQGNDTRVAHVDLAWGGSRVLGEGDFRPIAREQLVARGGRLALQSLQLDEAVGLEWASRRAETVAISTALRLAYLHTLEYAIDARFVAGNVATGTSTNGQFSGDATSVGIAATVGVRALWENRLRLTFAVGPELRWSWQNLTHERGTPTESNSFPEIGARTAVRFGVPMGRDITVSGEVAFSPLLRREHEKQGDKELTSLAIHTVLAGNVGFGYAF